jgi:Ca2+-binding RTX toxin-like protein
VLRGNSQANTLVGNGGTDILVGLGGNDTLSGGTSNDILIGGREANTLKGDQGEDLLIAGFTLSAGVEDNAAFVQTIATTWFGAGAFAARVTALTPVLIPASTVLTDSNSDLVSSETDGSLDLLFAALVDSVSKDAGDILTLL